MRENSGWGANDLGAAHEGQRRRDVQAADGCPVVLGVWMVDRRRRVAPYGHTDDRPGGRGRARGTLTARAGESGSAFRREMRFMERREGACL